MRKTRSGFTIVELLIVIVVIGVLAAITIVAYNGIQTRANDTAVQADLRNLGAKTDEWLITKDALPASNQNGIGSMGVKVSRNAYGSHYAGTANLRYCTRSSDNAFAFVAASTSGRVWVYTNGSVKQGTGPLVAPGSTCSNNGVANIDGGAWLFSDGSWVSWI